MCVRDGIDDVQHYEHSQFGRREGLPQKATSRGEIACLSAIMAVGLLVRRTLLLFCCCEALGWHAAAPSRPPCSLRAACRHRHLHHPSMLWNKQPAKPPQKRLPPPRPATPATTLVRRDLWAYAGLFSFVATIPAIEWSQLQGGNDLVNAVRLGYFLVVAIGSVYLGVQRQDLGEASPISGRSAALAPVFASVTLGGLYFLIKNTGLNPAVVYQGLGSFLALVATSELLQPIIGLALAGELLTPVSEQFSDEREGEILASGSGPATAIALAIVGSYFLGPVSTGGPLSLQQFAALNNMLGWGITMASLGVLALESFTAAAALLIGLFCYDAFFVFQSDVMLTVATQVEAPAKFLFAAVVEPGDTRYPFSILGLGDIVVPGAFVSLMRDVDREGLQQAARRTRSSVAAAVDGATFGPYFQASLSGYAFGLVTTFAANYLTKSGQPALVYIVPSLLLAAIATAFSRGEVEELFAFQSSRAAIAQAQLEKMRAEAEAARAAEKRLKAAAKPKARARR